MTDILVITGLSGAGRSGAAAVMEDLGWYVVDNLPTSLVDKIVELVNQPASTIGRLALVSGRQHVELLPKVGALRAAGHRVRLVFLDAATPELVRRYDATRRRHPLVDEADGLVESIELERELLEPVKAAADLVIDTTELNVHQLKARILDVFDDETSTRMQVAVESFGFKHGLPLDADVVMDVRFLPNPHWDEALRPLTGHDAPVRDYVLGQPAATSFIDRFEVLIADLLPAYAAEGKSYLTVAIGCTGGRHRSVVVAEELARRLRERGQVVRTGHRDLAR
ncbi:MAG: RNase adapter RapZ [Ilumatobacteraceae bacterium]|nr:MAG: RNase adapter RapZ [Actinomycetota bacterium]